MKLTKDQPGYYSDMLKELAKIDNTVTEKRVTYPSIDVARKKVKGCWVKFTDMIFLISHQEIYCTGVEMIDGVKMLIFSSFKMPVSEYTKPVSTIVNKSIKDYTAQPIKAGSYKYCESGGWYSMANLYEVDGKYYTDAY